MVESRLEWNSRCNGINTWINLVCINSQSISNLKYAITILNFVMYLIKYPYGLVVK